MSRLEWAMLALLWISVIICIGLLIVYLYLMFTGNEARVCGGQTHLPPISRPETDIQLQQFIPLLDEDPTAKPTSDHEQHSLAPTLDTDTPAPVPSKGDVLSVMSYNIRCNKDPHPFDLPSRLRHVIHAVTQGECVVICFQEATAVFSQGIVRSLVGNWRVVGKARRRSDETVHVAYRCDVLELVFESTYVYSENGPFVCIEPYCTHSSYLCSHKSSHVRIFTHVVLRDLRSGVLINVINTHFPLLIDEQSECLSQLGKYISQSVHDGEELIIAGDFNSHFSPSATDSPFRLLYDCLPGLDEVLGLVDQPTFTDGFGPDLDNNIHRLDYIFYRKTNGISVVDAQIMHPTYIGKFGKLCRPSDHEPIVARFNIK